MTIAPQRIAQCNPQLNPPTLRGLKLLRLE
jgi:hypothetical protein